MTAAFGPAPVDAPPNIDQLARRNVLVRVKLQVEEAARVDAECSKVERWYERSKWLGMFFDPAVARKHKWLPWVAVLVAYIVLGLIDFAVQHIDP